MANEESSGGLNRSIGPLRLFVLGTASIVGPWLVMTNWWISLTGSSIALAFSVLGLLCIPIGLVFGELTAMFPEAGGPFVYIKKAFSGEVTYWFSWALMLSYTVVLAFQLRALMEIIGYMWWPDMTLLTTMIISVIIALAVFLLNTRDVSIGTGIQVGIFATLAIVGFGYAFLFFASPQFDTANWQPFFQEGPDGFLTAVALMVTMFFGFEVIPQFAEEANYPANKQWKLMVGAILFVMAFDGAITLAESGMLPFETAIATPMLGAEIANMAYGPWLKYIIVFANLAAICGCLVGFWMGGSRLLLAMGRSGALPSAFAKVNKNNVPSTANVFILGVVLMFILLSGSSWLASLFTLMAVGVGMTYTGVSLAFIKLRVKNKEIPRPWKVPGGLATGVLALFGGLVIAYFTFAYFTPDVWLLFILYFALVGGVRVALAVDARKHPEKYGKVSVAGVETIAMTGMGKKKE
ncbi:MAG: APC family permease [Euryarchaeota archaeon]|nr:APC family permease [Euryarchaeota archaeon]